jgi:hypothetical protein
MADYFHSLSLLVLASEVPPRFDSADAIAEYHESHLYEQSDEGVVNYVMTYSRKGWLVHAVETLCRMAAVDALGFLYSADAKRVQWQFEETIDDTPWCLWAARQLKVDEMLPAVAAISALFEWSQGHIPLLAAKDFLGSFSNEDEIATAIDTPVVTTEPTLDEAVPYVDDGDGPWCLYSYLRSLQTLMRHAIEGNASVMHIVQLPR